MARIRVIEIANFRGIKALRWTPSPGVNCLIGPGDSGKSTVLDAVDLCLGARRSLQFADADFFGMDVTAPISITVTIGHLTDELKSLESYGLFLRSFQKDTGAIEDEPEAAGETVLSLNLTVGSDLEPVWTLVSERAKAQEQTRNLSWADRNRLAPTRIGVYADQNLGWRRGSVLNQLSEERPDASQALVKAARDARLAFGDQAEIQLGVALGVVHAVATELQIPVGAKTKALLDAHSVSFSGGSISLHDEAGVPLRNLGLGSTRLLVAGLQRRAAEKASMVLIDELEHGLEPHRICQLLFHIGAKQTDPPLQAFVTTHSPAALRELSGDQLFVLRKTNDAHVATKVGTDDAIQGAMRRYPEAFLAKRVVVCEGASEIGFLRGLDQYHVAQGYLSLFAAGIGLVDAGGISGLYRRVHAFQALAYPTAALRDDDVQPVVADEQKCIANGGSVFCWRAGRALEDELFLSLPDTAIGLMLDRAVELHGEELVNAHITTASAGSLNLAAARANLNHQVRGVLAKASRTKNAWFKTVTWMEELTRDIVGPYYHAGDPQFVAIVTGISNWMFNGG